jgi:hypothetical protein
MKKLIYFLFAMLTVACDNIHTVDAPWDTKPIPVVFSILSPDVPVQVYLNQTCNSNYLPVKNPFTEAKVFICGPDSNWTELTRLKADTSVFVDLKKTFSIEKGKTYSLKIELDNKTVHAQTTIPAVAATIESAVCKYKPMAENTSYSVRINNEWVAVNGFPIKVTCKLLPEKDYGYDLSAFANTSVGLTYLIDNVFESNDFACPKDSSSFMLRLYTLEPNFKKYQIEGMITEMDDTGGNLMAAIIQKFGGVLPQFSNIVNGVGLFSCYVTDSTRVDVTNYPPQN